MDLQYAFFNGERVVELPFFLEALTKTHEELTKLGIGHGGKLGFVPADETTCSWRSLVSQKQLVAKGASKTLYSNHRRGTAVDCVADWDYIKKIAPTMKKHGFVNDLAYWNKETGQTSPSQLPGYVAWDGGHWNWMSNAHAAEYIVRDELPLIFDEFSMDKFDNMILQLTEAGVTESGSFAAVYRGEKHIIRKDRAGLAALTKDLRGMKMQPVNKADWDSVPNGSDF